MRTAVAVAFLSSALLIGCATTDSNRFEMWDVNSDGRLDAVEFDNGAFLSWDRDRDGILETNEWNDFGLDDDIGVFDRWDANRDLGIDRSEFLTGRTGMWGTWDRDGDGFVEANEFGF